MRRRGEKILRIEGCRASSPRATSSACRESSARTSRARPARAPSKKSSSLSSNRRSMTSTPRGRAKGASLSLTFKEIFLRIESGVAALDAARAGISDRIQRNLRERIEKLAAGIPLDEARLAQEVAQLADRADITEEIDRLKTHLAEARRLLASDGAIGRRLDHLAQELHREVNTSGSKVREAGRDEARPRPEIRARGLQGTGPERRMRDAPMTRGDLFIVSSPSGAGKTTLIRRVLEDPRIGGTLHFSVSHTTRPPRAGETDGVEYHFVRRGVLPPPGGRRAGSSSGRPSTETSTARRGPRSSRGSRAASTSCSTSTSRGPGRCAPPCPRP